MNRRRRVDLPPMGEEPDDGTARQGGPTRTEEALGRLIRERAQLMEAITWAAGGSNDHERLVGLGQALGLVERLRAADDIRQSR